MKMNRRQLLIGSAALTGGLCLPRALRADGESKKLVLVYCHGGWDTTFCLDPVTAEKEANVDGPAVVSSDESIETFGDLRIAVNPTLRPAVGDFFTRWSDRAAVVNGVWVGSIAHNSCKKRMLTGTRSEASPDFAAIIGFEGGYARPIPYMDLGSTAFVGELAPYTGLVGYRSQLKGLLERDMSVEGPAWTYPLFNPGPVQRDAIDVWRSDRQARFAEAWPESTRVQDAVVSRERAAMLVAEGEDFSGELRLGRSTSLVQQASLGARLLEEGMSHTVGLAHRVSFDTHDDITDQHAVYEELFQGLDAVMQELSDRNLLEDTIVAVISEMSRTPKINKDGGKDHWPVTSAILLGAVKPGLYGGTTETMDPVSGAPQYNEFIAGVLASAGVDSEAWLAGVEAFDAVVA